MTEVYKIVANLIVTGNANKSMELFTKSVREAAIAVESLLKVMRPLNMAMNRLNEHLFAGENRTRRLTTDMLHLNTALNQVAHSGARAGESLATIRGGRRVNGIGQIERAESSSSLGYLASGAVMGGASRDLMHLAMSPGGLATAAVGYLSFKGFEQYGKYQKHANLLRFQGFTSSQLNTVNALAENAPRGFTQNEVMQAMVDAQMGTQNFGAAQKLITPLLQAKYVADTQFHGMNNGQMQALVRSAEIRGHGNGPEMTDWLQKFMQIYALSGGTMDFQQLAGMNRQGFLALTNQSFQGMAGSEPVMQVMNGRNFGTAMAGFQKSMEGVAISGTSMPRVRDFLGGLGMWDNKGGGKYGRLQQKYLSQSQTDMPGFVLNSLVPAIERKYHVNANTEAGRDTISHMLAIFNQNQARMLGLFITQMPKIQNTLAAIPRLQTLPQMVAESHTTNSGALKDLNAAWTNFSLSIGKTVTPIIVPALTLLTATFEKLAIVTSVLPKIGAAIGNKLGGNTGFVKFMDSMNFSNIIPHGANKGGTVETHLSISGHAVAKAVTPYIYKDMNRAGAAQSPSTVNWGQQLVSTGVPYTPQLSG